MIAQYKPSSYHPESQGAVHCLEEDDPNFLLSFERDVNGGVYFLLLSPKRLMKNTILSDPFYWGPL